MASFSTPLSGLDAASKALAVVGNNLANMNTTAYKTQTANFQDLFYQQLGNTGSGNPIQVGVGAKVSSVTEKDTQGSIQTTGVASDMAIQGNGFFVLQGSAGTSYTRAGNFEVNSAGQLVSPDGSLVQGYQATAGVVNTNTTPGALQVAGGTVSPPNATTQVQLSMNLDSTTATGGTYSTSIAAYDSLGNSHVLTYNFTNTGPNAWSYEITIPATDVGKTGAPVQVTKGTLDFDSSGNLKTPAADVTGISVASLADNAATMNVTWNLYQNGSPVVTQVAAPSTTAATSQDGYSSGSLTSFNVLSDGTVEGVFSNGQSLALGQVAVATFSNDQGLQRNGAGSYQATLASGTANVGQPGTAGRGIVEGGALELSNVDIATEFTNLIIAQTGYQASAKAISTMNTVTQDTMNLIQG